MHVVVNDKKVVFPSSLSELTLGQRIDFYEMYGRELDLMAESIIKMAEGLDKDLEIANYNFEKMFWTFAFFAGTTPEAIKDSEFVDDVAKIYYACLFQLFDEEKELEPQREFTWQGSTWRLQPPELKHGDKLTFGEFIDSKQIVKDMIEVGKGKWEYMLPLCAIYLRRDDEQYQESFLYEGSDRLKLMRDLPMDIALHVGFFLSGFLSFYLATSRSSFPQELKDQESKQEVISSAGDGQISLKRSQRLRSSIFLAVA